MWFKINNSALKILQAIYYFPKKYFAISKAWIQSCDRINEENRALQILLLAKTPEKFRKLFY